MRVLYDRWGPALARRISHPLLADLAYLSLKLPEALACGILWWGHYTHLAYTHNTYYSPAMVQRDEIQALLPLRPLEFLVLAVLDEAPRHGYAMVERIEARSDGVMRVRPGDLYRVLYRLQKRRLLSSKAGDERRTVYALTPLGRRVLEAEAKLLRGVVAGVGRKRKEKPA
jgi:DNA-binding PadR family transcriptional regulator